MDRVEFEGECYEVCHSIRNGKRYVAEKPPEIHDVVIIGAGISGLTAAHRLKSFDVRILEKEPKPGGSAKRGSWKGIYYSLGAADTGPTYEVELQGERRDFLKPLLQELEVPLTRVAEPTSALEYEGRIVVDPLHADSDENGSHEVRRSFEAAAARIEKIITEFGSPIIPLEAMQERTLGLDRKNLSEIFVGAGRPFMSYLQAFSSGTFGASPSEVSALKGLYYLSREMGERYSCPGGNACIAEALARKAEGRIELNSTVVSIGQTDNSCLVTYVDAGGAVKALECRAVIWASEKHYAPYIIKDLPKDQEVAFKKIRYSSFIVANVLIEEPFYNGAFATYFENAFFADLVVADWVAGGSRRKGGGGPSVHTLYCPLGSWKRHRLLAEPAEAWGRKILQSIEANFGMVQDKIAGIRLYRYGHHYVVSYPGFISRERRVVKRPFGNIVFAKDDTQGIPSLESAVWSGMEGAEMVKDRLQ